MPSVEKWENHHRSIENIVQGIQYERKAFKKDEYEDWRQKKYLAVRQRSKTKHFWSLWRQRQKGQYIVPEDIARDPWC